MNKKILTVLLPSVVCSGMMLTGCNFSTDTISTVPTATSQSMIESSHNTSEPENVSQNASATSSTDNTQKNTEGSVENGMLIINQNDHWRGLELFGGGSGDAFVNSLNSLRKKVGKDVRIFSMPIPLASEFYTPENYAEYSASQKNCFDNMAERYTDGITYVDAVSALAQHTNEEIYLRTDHHWQALGAYYAAQAFAVAADVPFVNLNTYHKVDVNNYVGTLYAFSEDPKLLNDPETFTYYEPPVETITDYYNTSFQYKDTGDLLVEVNTANAYLRYLGGDEQAAKIQTHVPNGRKLLVVKDSYGNAEIPFYTSSFEEIYVVDMRYFDCNLVNFIEEMKITDVLFTCAAYSAIGENAKNLEKLITQNPDSSITDAAPAHSLKVQRPEN